MKKNLYLIKFILLFLALTALPSLAMEPVFGMDNAKTVRIGIYDMAGFCQHDSLGNLTGYNIDYLNKIAGITGWDYEYVEIGSFDNGLIKLDNKQIDLLAPSQMTPSRIEKYDYSSYPFGTEYCSLITRPENDRLNYQDYKAFNGITVAVMKDYLMTDYFLEFAEKKGFQVNLEYYDTPNQALDAVRNGETDAAIANLMTVSNQDKVLDRFSPNSFYYMTWKGNSGLLEELNDAMIELNANYPSFENELMDKYFPIYKEQYLLKSEVSYAKSLGTLNVGYVDNMLPVSFTDGSTGEFHGMTRRILDNIESLSGLKFHYVPLPDGEIDKEFLQKNNISLVSGILQNSVNLNQEGMKLTNPYLSMQEVVVSSPNFKIDIAKDTPLNVAINSKRKNMIQLMEHNNPNFTIQVFDRNEGCFDAVKSGAADFLILNQYAADFLLSKPAYASLDILPVEGIPEKLCLGVISFPKEQIENFSNMDSSKLLTILNKAISRVSAEEVNTIIANESVDHKYHYSMEDFLFKYRMVLFPLAVFILMLILLLLYIVRLRNHSLKASMAEEAKLQSIANNISGGVLVLTRNKEFLITYMNEGLLKILDYNKSDETGLLFTSFISYVHEEDVSKLTPLNEMNEFTQNRVALQLRVRTKKGTYIQTLFCGTLTSSVSGRPELYCVIVDLSEQIAIKEQLVFQQRRHQLLLEKSDNIVYEMDIATGQITSSDKMLEKFGWQLKGRLDNFDTEDFIGLFKVCKEDSKNLHTFVSNTLHTKDTSECCVRILAKNNTFLWSKITSYPILNSHDEITAIIGLITDVDKETREKQRLMLESQTDGATGLLNKKTFLKDAQHCLEAKDCQHPAVIFIDLDHFKSVNDSLGHMTGDKAILDAAKKIQGTFSSLGLISRFGGDEFCIFIKNIHRDALSEKLTSALEDLRNTYSATDVSVNISASIGAVYNTNDRQTLKALLVAADQALYYSKENGRNCFTLRDI